MKLIRDRTSASKRIFVATAALAMFLLPVFTPGARASDSRWYVGLNVPVMFIDDSDSVERGQAEGIPYTANAVNEFKTGFRVSGVLGYEFGTGFRIDGEFFFARAAVGKLIYKGRTTTVPGLGTITIPGKRDITVSGSAKQLGGMVNVWYDFNTGSRWRPYVGAGLGVMQSNWGDMEYNRNEVAQGAANQLAIMRTCAKIGQGPNCTLPPAVQQQVLAGAKLAPGTVPELSNTDTVFAYQLGAGLGYEVTDAMTVQVGYRMVKSNQLEFTGRNAMGAMATATTDLQIHLFELGLRYRF